MKFASVYPHYITKAEKKGRTKQEVNDLIFWLTGYNQNTLNEVLTNQTDIETFFNLAPNFNPNANKITGVICGFRVEEMKTPLCKNYATSIKLLTNWPKEKVWIKLCVSKQ